MPHVLVQEKTIECDYKENLCGVLLKTFVEIVCCGILYS
ncbi:hypothetical protein RINTHH_11850 [Richelia intracellularis HH01]|uniref:Uncharacterized protein n=1 Tax=Richelia intracellularis HH01 TaxID=1165094 RepID=M1X2S6_9NOST|nr:hypothetical protein RINTHH_11850 [Richelia intracellularis HH01]